MYKQRRLNFNMEIIIRKTFGITFCLVWMACVSVNCGTLNDTSRLVQELLKSYDTDTRPVWNQSKPIYVYATFDIKTIQDFDEVAGKLTISGYLYLSWYDEALTWDSQVYNTQSITLPRKRVWHPRLVLANSYSKLEDIGADWLTVHVSSDGLSLYVPGDIYTVSCTADVTQYPFDQQVCSLMFVAWGYTADRIRLNLYQTEVLTTYFSENGEWTYVSADSFRLPGVRHQSADVVGYTITMKRKPVYLVINVILPIVFISLINILVFVLPAESGERVSFSLTVMLSLAVFMTIVEDNLPKTSDPIPKLSYYLTFSLISSVMICLFNVFSLWMFFKREDRNVPKICKLLVRFTFVYGPGDAAREIDGKSYRLAPDKRKRSIALPRINSIERRADDMNGNQRGEEVVTVTDTSGKYDVTWTDVSAALDRCSAMLFIIALLANSAYLASIAFNN